MSMFQKQNEVIIINSLMMIGTSVIKELNSNVNSKVYFAEMSFLRQQLLIKQSWFFHRFTHFLTIVVSYIEFLPEKLHNSQSNLNESNKKQTRKQRKEKNVTPFQLLRCYILAC